MVLKSATQAPPHGAAALRSGGMPGVACELPARRFSQRVFESGDILRLRRMPSEPRSLGYFDFRITSCLDKVKRVARAKATS